MPAAYIDHLWQSIWFGAVVWSLAFLSRGNSARLRLWLWRLAAWKFLVPFRLLYAIGGWLGFPVPHSAIPPPAAAEEIVLRSMPWAAPAQSLGFSTDLPAIGLALAAIATIVAAAVFVGIRRLLRRAKLQSDAEATRMAADWTEQPVPLGFFKAATLTGVAIVTAGMPVVSGAIQDRLWRQEILTVDVSSLQSAMIEMTEATPGLGFQSRIIASDNDVMIHNINIQDLVALVYGIGKFEIFGGAMPWLERPRYDVRIHGSVRAPQAFDPYSLREPVTDYLYERFGVSIRVNGTCQEPCGDHQSFVIERLPWCRNPLGPKLCR